MACVVLNAIQEESLFIANSNEQTTYLTRQDIPDPIKFIRWKLIVHFIRMFCFFFSSKWEEQKLNCERSTTGNKAKTNCCFNFFSFFSNSRPARWYNVERDSCEKSANRGKEREKCKVKKNDELFEGEELIFDFQHNSRCCNVLFRFFFI